MRWRAHVESLICFGMLGYRLWVTRETPDGRGEALVGPLMIKTFERGAFLGENESFMDDSRSSREEVRDFLQAMSDAAWEIGIKPKQIEDNSNELKATKYHLEDMRMLAGTKK